jgi:hypothetical protein
MALTRHLLSVGCESGYVASFRLPVYTVDFIERFVEDYVSLFRRGVGADVTEDTPPLARDALFAIGTTPGRPSAKQSYRIRRRIGRLGWTRH